MALPGIPGRHLRSHAPGSAGPGSCQECKNGPQDFKNTPNNRAVGRVHPTPTSVGKTPSQALEGQQVRLNSVAELGLGTPFNPTPPTTLTPPVTWCPGARSRSWETEAVITRFAGYY